MLNYEMWLVNTKMTQPHHWQSRYTQWVVNGRGLSCYHDSVQPDPDIKGPHPFAVPN
jgi:dolichyl-phosphate-mannose--protein O-mannosyl transferase